MLAKSIRTPRFSVVPLVLFSMFLAGCTPKPHPVQFEPAIVTPTASATETAASTPALTLKPEPTGTPTPIPPTATNSPSPMPAVPDRLLDWQEQAVPEKLMRFAFDGEWLVALVWGEVVNDSPRYFLVARRPNGTQEAPYERVFDFPEGKTASTYESGSGLQVAGGWVAVVSAPSGGDSALGYEIYLIDLESKTTKLLKKSERAYPGIALSERWLVLLDSSSEQVGGEWCVESYHLPDGPFQKVTCTEGRIQWPSLDGGILAYKYIEPGQECSVVKRLNLATGENVTNKPDTCQTGINVNTSETITTWYDITRSGDVSLGGVDTQTGPFSLDVLQWGNSQRVCGRSVYRLVANQGAIELRSYHPGGLEETLLRYRPEILDPSYNLPDGKYSQDTSLPEYSYFDFDCDNGWLAFYNGKSFLIAHDNKQAVP